MRILIVDDDPFVCQSLSTILGVQDDIDVVGTGTDGDAAVTLYGSRSPDVLLTDIQMRGRDGLSAAEEILAAHPGARIVFLTTFSDDDYIVRALRLGAMGYLIKQDVATIAPALHAVMAGQSVLGREVLARAAGFDGQGSPEVGRARDETALSCLSKREHDVVRLIAEGLDNHEIADRLCMGDGTVRNHISAILAKLDLRDRTQVAIFYYRTCR